MKLTFASFLPNELLNPGACGLKAKKLAAAEADGRPHLAALRQTPLNVGPPGGVLLRQPVRRV